MIENDKNDVTSNGHRDFRHRREEYITQLEEEITQRVSTIALLREEIDTLRTDNLYLHSNPEGYLCNELIPG